jgi:hypothetical protein
MGNLTITEGCMISDTTPHIARAWPVPGEPTTWSVTWLPGRCLTRDQAITAMTIAEVVAEHEVARKPLELDLAWWGHLCGWAEELGLTGAVAVVKAAEEPVITASPVGAEPPLGWPPLPPLPAPRVDVEPRAVPELTHHLSGPA